MLQALSELGWLHSRALSAGVHPQPVSMSFLPASSPRCFCAELCPSSAGVSMCGLLTASSGRSSPQILWGFFLDVFIKSDCSGLFRQQSHFLLSLEEAAGCLLLWTA